MVEKRKIALVTGAGAGIGRAVSLRLLKNGYNVALAGRNLKTLQETLDLAGAKAANGLVVPTDVSVPAEVDALFQAVKEKFGRLDLLFNNAGLGAPPVTPDELSVDVWQNVVNTNLNGSFYCARAAFGMMRSQTPMGGRIINNGSISAHVPRPYSVAYTSTKHAITGLTKCLSLDGRPFDIACGQIDIGNAETPMTAVIKKGVPQADLTMAPEPVMDVENVASAILYMDSLSLDANVQFMTIMATKMPFIGRG
ncbi:SDR family NAD(P)-dependent oxidoreductase [Sneathiella chungangensis]|uniref:SDR family NAD(P)-dependent oxidoreductase n=1 Tax=Sneathiella chungangensis TaxID=1418234 RepID=A0A845MDW1_9PROT|nr:SDR family oxidoreductase [Sneathiella chungangensis]MZR21885.1 SDR family NAD(P)-dependent oxidoreductase [Sneathiella chungangensis]